MKFIEQGEFSRQVALVRVDFNVPLNEKFEITDDKRIRESIPTIKYILDAGGAVVLMSHLGRPKKGYEEKFSLKHLLSHLSKLLSREVQFAPDCLGQETKIMAAKLLTGQVLLLENLRFYPEEEKGDVEFAKKLASYGSIYVNDAFGTAHRAHASTTIIAQFFEKKYAGLLMATEIKNADKIVKKINRPFTAIIGGAKVSDKIHLIENLIEKVDTLIIGGGMTYTFLKAKGKNIGKSLCEEDKLDIARNIMKKAKEKGINFILPVDSIVAESFSNDTIYKAESNDYLPTGWMGLDIGPISIENARKYIVPSRTILWNGPMGVFEFDNFAKGTYDIAKAVSEATFKGAFSLVGGGDSAAALEKANLTEQVTYISTGGGALLEYLEGKILPGIAALGD
ncbi:MAG: phosphoglycerate kinase [Bacteroidia bacterium]|nr:phosphoglycerate kinase [Bacteroidia bacterium]